MFRQAHGRRLFVEELMRNRFVVLSVLAAAVLTWQVVAPLASSGQAPVAGQPPAGAPGAPGARQGFGMRGGPVVVSPEVLPDRRVTFRLVAPSAQQVTVTGVPGGNVTMQKGDQGVWTGTTTAPLTPDIYQYNFSVDGLSIVDPVNTKFSPAFGRVARSAFQVPGDNAWTPIAGTPRGVIAHHVFKSGVTNDERDFFVYTPPGYDPKRKQPYPVVVLCHGLGDDAQAWVAFGGANITLDNLINQGKATPMIMVNPLGYGTNNGGTGIQAPEMQANFVRILNEEVMPVVFKQYHVSTNRNDHAMSGLSMGGGETAMALNNLDNFAWFGSYSGAYNNWADTIPFAKPPASGAALAAIEKAIAAAKPAQEAWDAETRRANEAARAAAQASGAADAGRGGMPAGMPGMPPGGGVRGASSGPMFDARLPLLFPNLNATTNSRIKLLWIGVGTSDTLLGVNRQFTEFLKGRGIKFTYTEYPGEGHVWPLWRRNFAEFAQLIFK
jgi:enterochelin esterase-like enzyme